MSQHHSAGKGRGPRVSTPYLVLMWGLLMTVVATAYIGESARVQDDLRFQNAVDQVQRTIDNRLEIYSSLLQAGSAFFAATDPMSVAQFRAYVARLNLADAFPGIQGIGYSARVPAEAIPALEAAMRAEGEALDLPPYQHFAVWPLEPPRARYHTILYLEPLDRRNQAALGYDMTSEPTRRAAMVQARDTGRPAASGRVTLVQEIDEAQQAGFLIYVPVYEGGEIPPTLAQRRERLQGFVYSPFRADDLLAGILGSEVAPPIEFRVYDGLGAQPDALLHASAHPPYPPLFRPAFTDQRTISVAGRPWTILFQSSPAFDRTAESDRLPLIPIGGFVFSLLLFGVTRAQVHARRAAEQLADSLLRSEAARQVSATRFRTLVEQSPLSIQILSPEGRTLQANRAWEALWGIRFEEMADYNILEDQQLVDKGIMPYIQRAFAGEATAIPAINYVPTFGGERGQNHWISAFIYPLRDEAGAIREIVLIHEDVSDRKRAEETIHLLAEAGAVLATSLDVAATLQGLANVVVPALADYCLIIRHMEDGSLEQVAAAHRDPAKLPLLHELAARYPYRMDNPHSLIAPVIRTGEPVVLSEVRPTLPHQLTEDPAVRALFEELAAYSTMIIPLAARGQVLGVMSLISADSKRRYTDASLPVAQEVARRAALALDNALLYQRAQEAIQIRDQFLSIASHDLKTPITSVKGYADLLLRRAARHHHLPERDQRAVGIIQEEAARLTRLVDLLLDVSRIQSGRLVIEREEVDLGALVARRIQITQAALTRHRLRYEPPAAPILVEGDELRLEQVIQNLLQNAIKYSPEGGEIHVTLRHDPAQATLTIRDEGIGIPPAAMDQLFHRFFRADNAAALGIGGQGLGLYIVRYIIRAHGGTIQVASEEGVGSTFTITLPNG